MRGVETGCTKMPAPSQGFHELMVLHGQEGLQHELAGTASRLATRGRGILAADESNGTIGKRLVAAGKHSMRGAPWGSVVWALNPLITSPTSHADTGLVNDEETRRAYREVSPLCLGPTNWGAPISCHGDLGWVDG